MKQLPKQSWRPTALHTCSVLGMHVDVCRRRNTDTVWGVKLSYFRSHLLEQDILGCSFEAQGPTTRSADASSMPRELLAMHVYVPASEMCDGEMSRLPDSSRVNLGSWTEPLANTRSPGARGD
ncbi:hypothetical protein EYF80_053987 [Liparis tanakae]|uniref:Uncharacterized protein n=1 Tax=Liparis tanakae TaxID=230148 RepID=A0A4Z2F419_9TELE|nr:hypothetical protein EYF80_053987 [Liparis tanakae]